MTINLETAIPLIISVVSIGFGIYQYFDKRKIEKKNAELLYKKSELELKEKEFQTKADPVVYYLQASMYSIFSYSRGPLSLFEQEPADHEQFDNAIKKWIESMEKILPFKVTIYLMQNSQYEELRKYCSNPDKESPANHVIIAMLIRNEGKYPASQITVNFHDAKIGTNVYPEEKCFPIKNVVIESLKENEAALILINHYLKNRGIYGIELEPDHIMKYYDKILGQWIEMKVRIPYEVPQLVDNGLLIRG